MRQNESQVILDYLGNIGEEPMNLEHLYRKSSLLIVVALFGLSIAIPTLVMATPQAPGHVPDQVGNFAEARKTCDLGLPIPRWLIELITFFGARNCHEALDRVDNWFTDAYRTSEGEGASPGYPINDIRFWQNVVIQEFTGGHWGEGAIIMKGANPPARPQYVGGGAWKAFKRAANQYGVFPGYPINTEHVWNRVRIQDFREGSWGDGAIIGGGNAELVAGNHWKAYVKADGSNRLRNPTTFMVQKSYGFEPGPAVGPKRVRTWWVQYFEGGEIWESRGSIRIYYSDTRRWWEFNL
jgi:hypothetical protein